MNVNTTTATLTQLDLNKIASDEQNFLRYKDLVLLANKNGLSVEDALFAAEESVSDAFYESLMTFDEEEN